MALKNTLVHGQGDPCAAGAAEATSKFELHCHPRALATSSSGGCSQFYRAFTPIKNIFLLLRKRSVLLSCQRLWEMSYTFLFVVRLMMPVGYKEDHRKQILLANSLLGEIQAVVGCATRTIKKGDNLKGYSLYIILTLCR